MKRAVIVLLLGVLFALLVFSFNQRDDGQTIIAEWERLGQAYADGEISYWEYVRRAEALIARRENLRRDCERETRTRSCPQE